MLRWQRRARLLVGLFAVAFAIVVALALRRRAPVPAAAPVVRTDPGAVVETTGGRIARFRLSREDVRVEYDRQLSYADGSTKLVGVRIVTDDRGGGRSFTVTGREAQIGKNDSTITVTGDVHLTASDGMSARAERATYADADGIVRAPGPVEFARGRFTGAGEGMTYDNRADIFRLLDQSVVHIAAAGASGAAEISSGASEFDRRGKQIRFEGGVKVQREGQAMETATAVAYLNDDETLIERLELRERSRITRVNPVVGGLRVMGGRDMNLKYREDGETLEQVGIIGSAAIELAGEAGQAGRQIAANTIDMTLASDGSTPESLAGREAAQLTLPAEAGAPARTIRSTNVDATGETGRGLTTARFNGNVQYRERGATIDRAATAETLDVRLKPGMSAIEEARFARAFRFTDGKMTAVAATARYDLDKGTLELRGSEPATPVPQVVNDQIAVDATDIDVTLSGPMMTATGGVKSVLQGAKADTKLPSMLKQDQPVNVTAGSLDYDGTTSTASYKGKAQLWQADTTIKAESIMLDDRSGDLTASGAVSTATMLEQSGKDKKTERTRSIGTATSFAYEESGRRATYSGGAHLSGPSGDMTAAKIELYLKPSGDEIDRAEAYDTVALRDETRKTTGARLTYTTADERYLVTGTPVTVIDECGRETSGKTLTYQKNSETMVVDGNEQTRTQTKGGGSCP
ncbi:MAG: LPS export ABC transporter periplasmic protein LptC [Acidobacteria bacterium]|nr:LPS export ABC transporter periplasmic protein LptC [Acidobacteriota bacterium]